MKIEKLKETAAWKNLTKNAKFEEEFANVIRRCSYHVKSDELDIEILNGVIRVSYNSGIKNRDLDSQFKLYNCVEFSLDDDNNLIVNELSGRLESNYGYDFKSTSGGKLITNYSTILYDENGIELFYQSYGDKYLLGEEEFDEYSDSLEAIVMEKYNPHLITAISMSDNYPKPRIVGDEGRFLRRIRSKNNLGIIEVSKCIFDKEKDLSNVNLEYYFNTFLGTRANCPELIHIVNGFPFATVSDDNQLTFKEDYAKLGLTDVNYQEVARERFLKELITEREKQTKNKRVLSKYDMMIERLERELGISKKTR